MPGSLMVGFDCEGKWGIADHLRPHDHASITDGRLIDAYEQIVDILAAHDVRATFAFVAAFTLDRDEYHGMEPRLGTLSELIPDWLGAVTAALREGHVEGWFGKPCLQAVLKHNCHEIASHGFSHVPWDRAFASRAALEEELRLLRTMPEFSPEKVSTFVYPRNFVSDQDLLSRYGFAAYRAYRPSPGRLFNLLSEFNVLAASDPATPNATPIIVPAGYFLNWRHGPRKWVPPQVTLSRWRHICRHAARTDGIAYLWCHPENFLTGDGMFDLFAHAVEILAEEQQRNDMAVLTQHDYALRVADRVALRQTALRQA
jgi:peptidoglycan/xylan/chitin deacetylase (PgdA/CDA1 family)